MPQATAVKVLHLLTKVFTFPAHSSPSQCCSNFIFKQKQGRQICQCTYIEPWPCMTPDLCCVPICPSDCRGAYPTGRYQSQQMVPVQGGCCQRPRDTRLHRPEQTLPLLQRSVPTLCVYDVCGLPSYSCPVWHPLQHHLVPTGDIYRNKDYKPD